MDAYVKSTIENQIATLSFFHPKGNSFPTQQLNALVEEINALGKNPDVRVILLRSGGEKVFCAGASFDELLAINDMATGTHFFMGFARVLMAMKNCPKFIIGCIEGKVVGGGVGLVAGCDYALALENASAKLSELSIGIGPFVIEPAITHKIGIQSFAEMTLNPTEWKTAEWAKSKGLFHEVFSDVKSLEEAVLAMAQNLSKYSPKAMQLLKGILWQNTQHWEQTLQERAAMSGELVLSDFTKQKLMQFKQK